MTYYLYHIPGKKIGVTCNLNNRVTLTQGYGPDEYEVLDQSDDIDYISEKEIELQKSYGYKVDRKKYDQFGNLSFGIHEYIEMPGTQYDPDIGMFGMDVSVNLERAGYRIARRKKCQRKIPLSSRITKEEAMDFFKKNFGVETE